MLLWEMAAFRNSSRWIFQLQLNSVSVGRTSPSDLLETEGLVTQRSRVGQSAGYLVGGIFALNDGSDWSNGLRYQNFDTKPDTEFNRRSI